MRFALLLLLCAHGVAAQPRSARCWAACERNVTEPRVRASACGACLTHPDDASAWISRAELPLEPLLRDVDWDVRFAALEKEASTSEVPVSRLLAKWIARTPDTELTCLTAVHAAGKKKKALPALLEGEPAALKTCQSLEPKLLARLGAELYDERSGTRSEALAHAALAFAKSPARVVLDALPSHPAAFDPMVLETLRDVVFEHDATPAGALLASAGPDDVKAMNRALAVFSTQRDQAKKGLSDPEPARRKEALRTLADLAPLSEPELLGVLEDPEAGTRAMAVRGLARGEVRTVSAMAARRLSGEAPATAGQQIALMKLVGDLHEADCASVALETWRDVKRAPALRALALPTAASCRWDAVRDDVETALASGDETAQTPAVLSLAWAPTSEQLLERLHRATEAPAASTRAAACEAIAHRRWIRGAQYVMPLVQDPSPDVRRTAARALLTLEVPGFELKVVKLLQTDADASVRRVAAEILGHVTGPRPLTALTEAARNDSDPDVKLVAAQSLRKLGAGSLLP